MNWLDHPAFQGGVAPLLVALIVGVACGASGRFGRTPVAWLAIVAGYLASTWAATGIAFSPLTATRKILLVVVVAAVGGLIADLAGRRSRVLSHAFVGIAAAAAVWSFWSIVSQREGAAALGLALGLAAFAAALTWLLVDGADDGVRTGAVGVGLGIATGVSAVLSASIGFLLSGMAVAASSGALLLVQVLGRRLVPAGYTGALGIGLGCALFAEGAMLLAELPWYALVLLLPVPVAVRLLDPARLRPMARASVLVVVALVAAVPPIAAAWLGARGFG